MPSRTARAAASPSPPPTSSRWTSEAIQSQPRWASGWRPGSSTEIDSGPGRTLLLGRALEEGLELDREAHVALDLELALHERGGAVHLPERDLHVILGRCQERQVRVLDLTLARFGGAVVDLEPPLPALVATQVELHGGVRRACFGGVEVLGHLLDHGVRRDLVGRHLLGHVLPSGFVTRWRPASW